MPPDVCKPAAALRIQGGGEVGAERVLSTPAAEVGESGGGGVSVAEDKA